MTVTATGTSGGDRGANGTRRRAAIIMAAGFLAILVAITMGNAESMISDFAASGVPETIAHVWIWEITSVSAWLSTTPAIWWAVSRVRPPRMRWWMVALAALIGIPIASAWHIGVTIGLRHIVYAASGESYRFEGAIAHPYLYEFRKDIATYLQFVGLAILAQWLLARIGLPQPAPAAVAADERRMFAVADGSTRHLVPIDTIEHVVAAGNYVEVHAAGRMLLHRATLASIEAELGATFVRIHRSRLVNRTAIRRVETDRSGDFAIELANGTALRGSRRYRSGLQPFLD